MLEIVSLRVRVEKNWPEGRSPLAGDLTPRPLKHAEIARERGSYLDPASFQFERGVEL